jgi:preprotein translocase subunit SecG
MEILKYIVLGLYTIVCVALIILATIQAKDSQGASGTITGSTTNNFYEQNKGRTKEGKMKRWTIILGIAFVILAIILGILYMV